MTKKDYILAARIVDSIRERQWTNELPSWAPSATDIPVGSSLARAVQTAEAFIRLFEDENSRFDRTRFLVACGLQAPPEGKKK